MLMVFAEVYERAWALNGYQKTQMIVLLAKRCSSVFTTGWFRCPQFNQILMQVTVDTVVQQYLSSYVRNCMASLNPWTRLRSLNFFSGSKIRAVISRDLQAALSLHGYTTQKTPHHSIWSRVLPKHFSKSVSLAYQGLKQI